MSHDHDHESGCKCCTEVLLSCNLLEVELLAQSSAMQKLQGEMSLFLGTGCHECAGASVKKADDRLEYLAEYLGEEGTASIVDAMEQRFVQSTGQDVWRIIRDGGETEQTELKKRLAPQRREAA